MRSKAGFRDVAKHGDPNASEDRKSPGENWSALSPRQGLAQSFSSGPLRKPTIDATGLLATDPHNPFGLLLKDTLMGDSSFGSVAAEIINGRLFLKDKPTAAIAGPVSVAEGGSGVLSAAGCHAWDANDTLVAFEWDLDGDGVFGEAGAEATRGDELGVAPTFSAAGLDGPAAFEVKLRVKDNNYAQNPLFVSETVTAEIPVNNVPPTIDVSGDNSVNEGAEYSVTPDILTY